MAVTSTGRAPSELTSRAEKDCPDAGIVYAGFRLDKRGGRNAEVNGVVRERSSRPHRVTRSADLDRLQCHLAEHAHDGQKGLERRDAVEAGGGEVDVHRVNRILLEGRGDGDPPAEW